MAEQVTPEGIVLQVPEHIHKGDITTVPSGNSYKVRADGTISDVDPGDVQALKDHGYTQPKAPPVTSASPAQDTLADKPKG